MFKEGKEPSWLESERLIGKKRTVLMKRSSKLRQRKTFGPQMKARGMPGMEKHGVWRGNGNGRGTEMVNSSSERRILF